MVYRSLQQHSTAHCSSTAQFDDPLPLSARWYPQEAADQHLELQLADLQLQIQHKESKLNEAKLSSSKAYDQLAALRNRVDSLEQATDSSHTPLAVLPPVPDETEEEEVQVVMALRVAEAVRAEVHSSLQASDHPPSNHHSVDGDLMLRAEHQAQTSLLLGEHEAEMAQLVVQLQRAEQQRVALLQRRVEVLESTQSDLEVSVVRCAAVLGWA